FQPVTDFRHRDADILGIGQIDLDMIFGPGRPWAILRESLPGAGDDAPSFHGKTLHRRMADAAARPGQNDGLPAVCMRHDETDPLMYEQTSSRTRRFWREPHERQLLYGTAKDQPPVRISRIDVVPFFIGAPTSPGGTGRRIEAAGARSAGMAGCM